MSRRISLIVCAKNEENRIGGLLKSIHSSKQDELVFVLDRCTDKTKEIIENFDFPSKKNIIEITENPWQKAPKKFAVLTGIKGANNENLLFTDADCTLPKDFFEISRSLFDSSDIIIGISLPEQERERFAETFHFIDFVWTAGLYSFLTRLHFPFMSVGRNWGFKRHLFEESFISSHREILSGDDDLLFQQLNKKNPTVILNDLVNVDTRLLQTFPEIIKQKTRHLKAGAAYQPSAKLVLFFISAVEMLGWLGFLVFLFQNQLKPALISIVFPISLYMVVFQSLSRIFSKFKGKKLSPLTFVLIKPIHTFFLLFLSLFSFLIKDKWK